MRLSNETSGQRLKILQVINILRIVIPVKRTFQLQENVCYSWNFIHLVTKLEETLLKRKKKKQTLEKTSKLYTGCGH